MITLKTLKDTPAQKVFDQVAVHFLSRSEKCEFSFCKHIKKESEQCQLNCGGNCIHTNTEPETWLDLLKPVYHVPDNIISIMCDIRHAFDNFQQSDLKEKFKKIAELHQLDSSVIN